MLRNYFIIAWRNLLRHKVFSFINISGLSVAIAACLLILQYILFEFSYDKFHIGADRIYRVKHERYQDGALAERSARSFSAIADAMKNDFPEVHDATTCFPLECIVSAAESENITRSYKMPRVLFASASFLKIFTFPIVKGRDALDEPNSLILTASTAKRFFGNEDPIGKKLRVVNFNQGTDIDGFVKGVCSDIPANSHLQFDMLVSTNPKDVSWTYADNYTYVELNNNTNAERLESKLPAFLSKYTADLTGSNKVKMGLQPLTQIHLYSDLTGEPTVSGTGKLVWFMVLIAILILMIAYINYINLSTVKAMERAREVGLRKVFGSERLTLMKQFFFESLLLNFVGIIIAIIIALFCHELFNQLAGVDIPMGFWTSYWFWLAFLVLLIGGALVSGIYPAYLLSGYQPIQVLKGKLPLTGAGISIRKILVIFQFAVSIALIIGTYAISRQVNYMRETNLGLNIDQTVIIDAPANKLESQGGQNFYQRINTFRASLLQSPNIKSVTAASSMPGLDILWNRPYQRRDDVSANKGNMYATFSIGPEFINQFDIKVIAGQQFSITPDRITDSAKTTIPIMINESAVKAFGYESAKDAVGKILIDKNGFGVTFEYEIVGVLQNFHQKSLKESFTPIVFRLEDGSSIEYYAAKVSAGNIEKTIAFIEKSYKELFPASPFQYAFLDEFFDRQYRTDVRFGKIFGLFSGFAIFVACLGLLGLSLFTSMQRTKEIGVRITLGASAIGIFVLLVKDFMKLILIACCIAWPLAWWGLYQWLQHYPFRIGISPLLFFIPTFIVLFIALLTVAFHTWKAGNLNPIKALKYE